MEIGELVSVAPPAPPPPPDTEFAAELVSVTFKSGVVAVDSPDRTAFGNHAFASAPSKNILDACAGPHTGAESPEQYVAASIDTTPSLYGGGFRAGKASDIVPGPGVTGVQ
jgi:hypothetical protein